MRTTARFDDKACAVVVAAASARRTSSTTTTTQRRRRDRLERRDSAPCGRTGVGILDQCDDMNAILDEEDVPAELAGIQEARWSSDRTIATFECPGVLQWNDGDGHHFPNQIRITGMMRGYARHHDAALIVFFFGLGIDEPCSAQTTWDTPRSLTRTRDRVPDRTQNAYSGQ